METNDLIPVGVVDCFVRFSGHFSGRSCFQVEQLNISCRQDLDNTILHLFQICAMVVNGKNSQIGAGLWCGTLYCATGILGLLAVHRNDKAM